MSHTFQKMSHTFQNMSRMWGENVTHVKAENVTHVRDIFYAPIFSATDMYDVFNQWQKMSCQVANMPPKIETLNPEP